MRKKIGVWVISLSFFSCGQNTGVFSATGCDANSALIGVYDSALEIFCGCTEPAGTVHQAGSPLTCTLASTGVAVVFQYIENQHSHQIVSQGSPAFASSHFHDPLDEKSPLSHGVLFSSSGTYSFQDAMNSALSGQIVVP